MKRAFLFFCLATLAVSAFAIPLSAQQSSSSTSTSSVSSSSSVNEELEKRIADLQKKLDEARQQKNTLSSQIQEMDAQIYLKTLTIQQTEQKITSTQKEIETLSDRIVILDTSLTDLIKKLKTNAVVIYKKRQLSFFDMILNTDNIAKLLNIYKYQKTAENKAKDEYNDYQLAKTNYEEQRVKREEKKKELDSLIATLANQKSELVNSQEAKKRLLEVTRNDEATYQRLLEQAQKERTSFTSFVKYAGGGAIGANGFGGGAEGWYLSQRDERWAYRLIGMSDMNLLEVGCLVSNVAMAYRKYGENVTPADIAAQSDRFFSNTAMMLVPWRGPGGRSYVGLSRDQIDNELSNGNTVIVGVYAGAYGTHYVTLVKKDGDDYLMYDPYYGPDLKFTSRYSFGSIFSAATFR